MTRTSAKSQIISRRVTRYETSDKQLHDTLTAARLHQVRRDLYDILKHDEHLAARDVNIGCVVDLLCDNAGELSPLLRRFIQLQQTQISKPNPGPSA